MKPLIAECRRIAKKYDVKVKFKRFKGAVAGQADLDKGEIIINSLLSSRQETLSCMFHELAHFYCFRHNLFQNYHNSDDNEVKLKIALKAERYMDRWAAHQLYLWDKRLRYLDAYTGDDKEMRKFLEDYYNSEE